MAALSSCLLFLAILFCAVEAGSIGVNYGRVANNLPSASRVAELLKSQGINQVRIFDANPSVLRSLAGTGIKVIVTLPNELLASAAARPFFALAWIRRNVAAYYPSTAITTVAVGNEVFADTHNRTGYLLLAMKNLHDALVGLHLDGPIKISTSVALSALQSSYPPSAGAFRADLAETVMRPMLELLRSSGSFLMVNAYPFLAYEGNSDVISLDYALFRPNAGVLDPGTGLKYYSLFDAQLDAVFTAIKALKCDDVKIVVSETGWPSKGDVKEIGAGEANAAAYNGNLVRRVLSGNAGTPLKPQADIDVYLFALFNENMKPGPTSERNFGLFYPNEAKVYDLEFTLSGGNRNSGGGEWDGKSTEGREECQQGRRERVGVWRMLRLGRRGCRQRWTTPAVKVVQIASLYSPVRLAMIQTRSKPMRRTRSTATTRRKEEALAPVTLRTPPISSFSSHPG